MSRSGITIQPKPEGNHYVTIHRCYKDITDGKESTAALLSVLEYLAECTVARSGKVSAVPELIEIDGDCNYPLINSLLDGMLKPTAVKNKLRYLDEKGFISSRLEWGRKRKITYNRRAIADALAGIDYAKSDDCDPSKSDHSESDPSKSDHSTRQKVTGTRQKVTTVTRQKVTPTIHITNHSSNQETNLSFKEENEPAIVTLNCDSSPTPVNPKSNYQVGQQIANTSVEDQCSAPLPVNYQSGAAKVEARFRAGQVSRPWRECDDRLYQGFRESVKNTLGFKDKSEAQLIDLANGMIRKADYASPGQWEFDRIADKWAAFMERCQSASTPAEAVAMTRSQKLAAEIAEIEARSKIRYQQAYGGVA